MNNRLQQTARILMLTLALGLAFIPRARAAAEPAGPILYIDITTNVMTLYDDGVLVKTYHVSSGRRLTPTPTGVFKITAMYRNWGAGFGSRFMAINVPWGLYGIHGTDKPSLIGASVSKGCVRMRNGDIEDLYTRVRAGTPVVITSSDYGFLGPMLIKLSPGNRGAAVLEVQKRLKNLGYNPGSLDGIYGEQTKRALLQFKRDRGLDYTHDVDSATYRALGVVLFE